ncbi:MAG TPA: response regulator [Verrucomicrobiota bacterium]|nr:response regulator [Verrucomicrobiota bacterium]
MRRKILVVDDDSDTLELLQFILKKAGYAVGTARDGVEALKKVCSLSPDLVVVDLMMPEIDGLGVCETIRSNPMTSRIPIVMLTAVTSQMARFSGLEAGANEFVTKPFSPKVLVSRIEELIG